ncbi:Lon protease family protein [methane-oxidizing endosymbiont of Gigantopelta aegis]|uniref:Lon protease family protein n=1 Tax=methane-oxidizing endosymbiont of Gigantopelta aegis TaxID=2794938 RepID=UPI0018DCC739|nr:ATP-binding protein [methane-oxidizing endosymbiont of Gigantopelta aegis]
MEKLPVSALKLNIELTALGSEAVSGRNSTILGQDRAKSALVFGVAMQTPGYNIYVMGEPGTGRLSMITDHLSQHAHQQDAPAAYAYVDNFENPREPIAIRLAPGQGNAFNKDIEKLIDNLLATFPAAFESPTYQQKKTAIERNFNQRYNKAIELVDKKARSMNIALFRDNEAITFLPIRDNKALDEDEFMLLSEDERETFLQHVEELEEYLSDVLLELPQWRRNLVDELRQLDSQTIEQAIAPLFDELNKKYQDTEDVIVYLAELKKNLTSSISDFLMPGRTQDALELKTKRALLTEQFLPNILVDHKVDAGAPIIYESHPIYSNLFGRIEYISDQGTLVTNYRRICAGSLHRANGGYLILDAEKVLTYPFVWEGLKRALKAGRIEIESPFTELGVNTITLKPEVIPLDVKVILVGPRDIYYLLEEMDSEFNEMFRILSDFDDHIERNDKNIQQFAQLMIQQAKDIGAKPLTRDAILRLIEHSCRLAENQNYLSARINDSLEIISEANFISQQETQQIGQAEIDAALKGRDVRNGRISEEILNEILDGTILIDSEGEKIGKINGLTVLEIGGSRFGAPARITATVYPGSRGIVDIEREAELGQSIHTKGIMILTGYLGNSYAQQFPLAISASIAIEQSYGHIDGDSASLAELCCLISALTRTPIKQGFAVTGSINQYGEVQAVGGINEKIEGFFNLCQARGLTGEQAVIIPASNKRNLMLKQTVIDAVADKRFAIYTVETVNQALELLTGMDAGELNDNGEYPDNSINQKAVQRLKEISEMAEKEHAHEEG